MTKKHSGEHKPDHKKGKHGKCGKHGRGVWQIFFGLCFLAAATAVILSMFNIVTFGMNIGWVLLGIFLSAMTLACLFKLQWFGVFLPVAGILTILITQTDWLPMDTGMIGPIWIAAPLLAIGFSILFHNRKWSKFVHVDFDEMGDKDFDTVIDEKDDSKIFVGVNMGSTVKYVNSEDFKQAMLKCNLGAIKVYFDNAKIKGDIATIEVNGNLSGFELYIPRNWQIVDNLRKSAAGIEEKNTPRSVDSKDIKTIYLTGSLTMSGIEIVYV